MSQSNAYIVHMLASMPTISSGEAEDEWKIAEVSRVLLQPSHIKNTQHTSAVQMISCHRKQFVSESHTESTFWMQQNAEGLELDFHTQAALCVSIFNSTHSKNNRKCIRCQI